MASTIQGNNGSATTRLTPPPQNTDPRAAANTILAETSGKPVTYDRLGQIEARLDTIARTNPDFAAQVRGEIMASSSLSATDKGTLRRNEPGTTVDLDGKITNRFAPGGKAWDPWINENRAAGTPEYKALVKLAGSTANEPIKAVMQELIDRGMNTDQLATARLNEASAGNTELAADLGQLGLDIVGIFDPTPTADLVNAGISAWRGDGWGAFLSVLSAVPYVGDLAKLGKLGKWAETVAKAVDAAAHNPTARAMLGPALRKVSDLIGALPAKAFDALPASAKTTLLEMKGKIDGLLGVAGKKGDDVAVAALSTVQRTFGQNSVKWVTDGEGRLISASAVLKEVFPGLTRSSDEVAAQGRAAANGIPGDHGGHAVPHRFVGDQGAINMFPQNGVAAGSAKNFNGSAFKTLENELADWVQAGGTVKYDVSFSNFAGKRAGTVGIEYKVFDKAGNEVFRNGDMFKNEAGQVFERVSRAKIETILNGAAR